MFWMLNVLLNKLSWKGAMEIHCLTFCSSSDQRSILTTSGGSIHLLRLIHFKGGETVPYIMITGNGRWIPPPLSVSKNVEHEKESASTYAAGRSRRAEVERTLTDPQRDKFEDKLCALPLERSQLKEAMGFALDNADAVGECPVLILWEAIHCSQLSLDECMEILMQLKISLFFEGSAIVAKYIRRHRELWQQ